MKSTTLLLSLLLCSLLLFEGRPFEKLSGLAGGTWVMKTRRGYVCERWLQVNDTLLQSQGYKVIGSDTILTEAVQMVEKRGLTYYIPTVRNQNGGKAVVFPLIGAKGNEFTFYNHAHDYPQRIVYDLVAPDSLHAWVGDTAEGKAVRIDYYYRRVR